MGKVPALFLHIQKTAGTSLIELARKHYGTDLTSHGDCWGHAPEAFSAVRFVSGHIGYDFAKSLIPGRFSFTFLRDPADRILSLYYFCRKRDPAEFKIYECAHYLDLDLFLEAGFSNPWIKKNIWNNQVWQLAHGYAHIDERTINDFGEEELLTLAKEHLKSLSYVGFTETFDSDAAAVMAALALPELKQMPRLNDSPDRPCVTELSPYTQSLLGELTLLDRKLYDYAWELYMTKRRGLREK